MSTDVRTAPRTAARAASGLRASLKWILLGVGLVFALVPFVWMVTGSFRTEADLFAAPASLWPQQWSLHGYRASGRSCRSCG